MYKVIVKVFSTDIKKRRWFSVIVTVILAGLSTLFGIYIVGEYGIALFILTPLFIGFCATILFGNGRKIGKKESAKISLLTLGVFSLGLLLFAIEGLICILMAAPLAIPLTLFGSVLAYLVNTKFVSKALPLLILFAIAIPITAFTEKGKTVTTYSVVTEMEIDADIQTVWHNVIEFPKMDEPTEFIFNAGISYPINAEIKIIGSDTIRYCNFNTGSFVEPITKWEAPTLLRFVVREQPEPMTEYSIWDIDAPHLHDYFVSEKGEFRLIQLPDGKTLLRGETWYHHQISPGFYWKGWSDWIIHSIHHRVLDHIKVNSEHS